MLPTTVLVSFGLTKVIGRLTGDSGRNGLVVWSKVVERVVDRVGDCCWSLSKKSYGSLVPRIGLQTVVSIHLSIQRVVGGIANQRESRYEVEASAVK